MVRRLLSGWLIALAALARSMARALERAAEARSEPIPDPVMAGLAERYPGAPAHWLAHVAERTSRMAEAGETPLSLTSDPSAWPSPPPAAAVPPSEPAPHAAAGTVESDDTASRPGPPRAAPPPRRDPAAVPSLIALRDRPSEVWRRPDAAPRRRPRPVFAFVGDQARASGPSSAPSAPQAGPSETSPSWPSVAEDRRSPAPDGPPAPVSPPEKPRASAFADRPATERDDAGPRPVETPPTTKRRLAARPWFFQSPASGPRAFERPVDAAPRAAGPGGGRTIEDEATAAEPAAAPREAASPKDRPRARRRPLFRSFVAPRAEPRATVKAWADPISPVAPATADVPSSPQAFHRSSPTIASPSRSTSAGPRVAEFDRGRPPSPVETRAVPPSTPPSAPRKPRLAWTPPAPGGAARVQDRRPGFTAPHGDRPREAFERESARSSEDGRWPAFPPVALASPGQAEAPPPRLDQLARDQEEGRWNA